MKFKHILALSCCVTAACAYTQSDLLSAQYAYQDSSNNVTQAKTEKQDASEALAKSKKKLEQAQKDLQQAQQNFNQAQTRFSDAESNLVQTNRDFGVANAKLNQIWTSLNPNTTPNN
jgi:septal ring factor EnvC (AmiA/AmiB activator)